MTEYIIKYYNSFFAICLVAASYATVLFDSMKVIGKKGIGWPNKGRLAFNIYIAMYL